MRYWMVGIPLILWSGVGQPTRLEEDLAKEPKDPQYGEVHFYPGVNGPDWDGVDKRGSSARIADNAFRHLENIRFDGGDMAARPGQSLVDTGDSNQSGRCIYGINEIPDDGLTGLLIESVGGPAALYTPGNDTPITFYDNVTTGDRKSVV